MKKFNIYDFDKTIYDGDSTLDFYLFCLIRRPYLIFIFPYTCAFFVLYKLGIVQKKKFKEKFFVFLKFVKNIDKLVDLFWDSHLKKIKTWFLNDKKENKIIISASPEFLLKNICDRLKIDELIASIVDKNTGKFISENCYGEQKLIRLNEKYSEYIIDNFYSDSKSDIYLAKISRNSYLVNKNNITKWDITRKDVN